MSWSVQCGRIAESRFRTLAVALLGILATVQVLSIRQEAQTWDEGLSLAAGYSYWKTGDFRLNRDHPPLGKLIGALPLLLLQPRLPLDDPSWARADGRNFGVAFLYQNRLPADSMLLATRLTTILLTLGLGAALAWWARQRFGARTALFALLMFCFEPTVIAHGRYVTSDMVVTVFSFLACLAWAAYLTSGRRRDLVLAGLALGLAMTSKFSGFFLLPVFGLLFFIRWWQQRQGFGIVRMIRSFTAVAGLSALVIVAVYAPEAKLLIPGKQRTLPGASIDRETPVGRAIAGVADALGLESHSYAVALSFNISHNLRGHPSYLMGMHSMRGWWYYFPVAFAVKTPTAILLALGLALAFGLRLCFRRGGRGLPAVLREADLTWFVLLVPAAVFGALSLRTAVNIGIRHLLPLYPFLFVLVSAALFRTRWKRRPVAVAALAVLLAAESLSIYPHYLAFFNWPSGGPGNGQRYLVDSNIDWGQDLKRLKAYLDAHRITVACTCYFGTAPPWYYRINDPSLPGADEPEKLAKAPCQIAAVSVTPLYGVYVPPERFAWLRRSQPLAKIGYSIYLFDLKRSPLPGTPGVRKDLRHGGSRDSRGARGPRWRAWALLVVSTRPGAS